MIHVLYPALRELIATIMLHFLQTQVVGNKTGTKLQKINVRNVKNMQTLQKLEIGETTKQATMKLIKVEQHNGLLLEMRNFFICCAEYLQQNLPLDNGLLRAVQCLSPSEQTKSESEGRIKRLGQKMSQSIADGELSSVAEEWKLYALDNTPAVEFKNHEVDRYWSNVLDRKNALGQPKYFTLGKVVRAALALSHVNSDAERSYLVNKRTVTPERSSLNQDTMDVLRMVKDAIRLHVGGQATDIVMTGALLQRARGAYRKYKEAEEKKLQEELEMKRKSELVQKQAEEKVAEENERTLKQAAHKKTQEEIRQQEIVLISTEKAQHNILKSAEVLLSEAESKLGDAIKQGDVDRVSVAHGLLEVARIRTANTTKELRVISEK